VIRARLRRAIDEVELRLRVHSARQANKPLCEYLGETLAGDGGAKLRCEVVRGERAPVKVEISRD